MQEFRLFDAVTKSETYLPFRFFHRSFTSSNNGAISVFRKRSAGTFVSIVGKTLGGRENCNCFSHSTVNRMNCWWPKTVPSDTATSLILAHGINMGE